MREGDIVWTVKIDMLPCFCLFEFIEIGCNVCIAYKTVLKANPMVLSICRGSFVWQGQIEAFCLKIGWLP